MLDKVRKIHWVTYDNLSGTLDVPDLLEIGKIAATPMVNWGSATSSKFVRLVYSNEPVQRLRGSGQRFRDALTKG